MAALPRSLALRTRRRPQISVASRPLLRTAVRIRPSYAAAWNDLGNVCSNQGHLKDADPLFWWGRFPVDLARFYHDPGNSIFRLER